MKHLRMICMSIALCDASFAFAAQSSSTILPDNVILCQANAGCFSKTAFGISYKVIRVPRFTVMASLSEESGYERADITILNNSGLPLNLTPDDFRIEVLTPKPRVLSYVSPADLKNVPPPAAIPPLPDENTPAGLSSSPRMIAASNSQNADIDELYTEAKRREILRQAHDKAVAQQPFHAALLAPNEMTSGRVYFEGDKHVRSINLVIPVAGLVFEFPYEIKR